MGFKMNNNYKNELKFYKLIGVFHFKRFVLFIEKLLYKKKNKQLFNYHPSRLTNYGLEEFRWCVFLNCSIHCLSAFLALVCLIYGSLTGRYNIFVALFWVLIIIGNIYCILLQRCNYIRIKQLELRRQQYLERRFDKAYNNCKDMRLEAGDRAVFNTDIALLDDIEAVYRFNKNLYLNDNHLESLKRIADIAAMAGVNFVDKHYDLGNRVNMECALFVADPYKSRLAIIDRIRKCFDSKRFSAEQINGLLITGSAECELWYHKTFGAELSDSAIHKIRILKLIYEAKYGEKMDD